MFYSATNAVIIQVDTDMTYHGHVKNGQISLDGSAGLPEGARVQIEVVEDGNGELPFELPLRHIKLDPELAQQIAVGPEFHPDEF